MKTFDGHEKSLLRAAAADVLPESVRGRRKSPYPPTQDPRYERALCDEVRNLLADPDAPVLPLLDTVKARALADRAATAGPLGYARFVIEATLSVNEWLRRYPVRLHLD
ncbi:asparagine synthase-related protein [Actinoplanes subtropicus]|uniref:asparagine synthase-related protein n=1 Tax=Actinoplanes subtropicus TaxID=543632 RepID=UPI00068AF2F5